MSNLFYQTKSARPVLDRAEGIHMWDKAGKRYIDGSSGAMVSNIGHSNPAVLAAMRAQMDRSTFGYRLHFQTEASEMLAARTAGLAPDGLNRVFFVSGGSEAVESALKLARQYALASGPGAAFQGDLPPSELSRLHAGRAGDHRIRADDGALRSDDAAHAQGGCAARLSRRPRPGRSGDGAALCRHAGGEDPGGGARTPSSPSSWSPSAAPRPGRSCPRRATCDASARYARATACC